MHWRDNAGRTFSRRSDPTVGALRTSPISHPRGFSMALRTARNFADADDLSQEATATVCWRSHDDASV